MRNPALLGLTPFCLLMAGPMSHAGGHQTSPSEGAAWMDRRAATLPSIVSILPCGGRIGLGSSSMPA